MWLRIALFYDVGYLARPLVSYRRHDAMETLRLPRAERLEQSYLAKMLVIEKYPQRVPDVEALRRQISEEYQGRSLAQARWALEEGRPDVASEYLKVTLAVGWHRGVEGAASISDQLIAALAGPVSTSGCREALEAKLGETEAQARAAETRVEELARAVAERDQVIGAMGATLAWRTARRWWWMKDAARRVVGRDPAR
jgi:hypothetical protein